jgi:hypothetical protein
MGGKRSVPQNRTEQQLNVEQQSYQPFIYLLNDITFAVEGKCCMWTNYGNQTDCEACSFKSAFLHTKDSS